MTPNIVGNIETSIAPVDAEFCTLSPDGKFIALWYKVNHTTFSDGSKGVGLSYMSGDFNVWRGTNQRDPEAFLKNPIFYSITRV